MPRHAGQKVHQRALPHDEEMYGWMSEDVMRPMDLEKEDKYSYLALRTKVREAKGVVPMPIQVASS